MDCLRSSTFSAKSWMFAMAIGTAPADTIMETLVSALAVLEKPMSEEVPCSCTIWGILVSVNKGEGERYVNLPGWTGWRP